MLFMKKSALQCVSLALAACLLTSPPAPATSNTPNFCFETQALSSWGIFFWRKTAITGTFSGIALAQERVAQEANSLGREMDVQVPGGSLRVNIYRPKALSPVHSTFLYFSGNGAVRTELK